MKKKINKILVIWLCVVMVATGFLVAVNENVKAGSEVYSAPTLVTPSNEATLPVGDVTLDWNPVSGCDVYYCEVADHTTKRTEFGFWTEPVHWCETTSTSWTISSGNLGAIVGTWYWHVYAYNSGTGDYSPFSETWSYEVEVSGVTLPFEDGFENIANGDYPNENGWFNHYSGVDAYVTTEKSYEGSKSFKLIGRSGGAREDAIDVPLEERLVIEAAILETTASGGAKIGLRNMDEGACGKYYLKVFFGDDGNIYAGADDVGEQVIYHPYYVNTWYLIRVEADFIDQTMNVYINGNLAGTDISILGTNYQDFEVSTSPYSNTVYFDNIRISTQSGYINNLGWPRWGYDLTRSNYFPYPSRTISPTEPFVKIWSVPKEGTQLCALTGDVNGDGKLEVVKVSGTKLRVYNGNSVELWNRNIPTDGGVNAVPSLTLLEDVTGDGIPEIFVRSRVYSSVLKIYVYDGSGNLLKEISKSGGYDSYIGAQAVFDFNNDGNKEIVASSSAGYSGYPRGVEVFDYNSATEKWYYATGGTGHISSMADLDNDGKIEIAYANSQSNNGVSGSGLGGNTTTTDGAVYTIIFDENGYEEWTKYISDGYFADTHFVDMNRDGDMEVLVLDSHDPIYYRGTSYIYLLDRRTGNILRTFTGPMSQIWQGYAIADINNDGKDELIVGSGDGFLRVLDYNLNLLNSKQIIGRQSDHRFWFSLTINDINGDGNKEILIAENDAHRLLVLDNNLNELWSYSFAPNTISIAALSDITGNGVNDIILVGDELVVLSYEGVVAPQPDLTALRESTKKALALLLNEASWIIGQSEARKQHAVDEIKSDIVGTVEDMAFAAAGVGIPVKSAILYSIRTIGHEVNDYIADTGNENDFPRFAQIAREELQHEFMFPKHEGLTFNENELHTYSYVEGKAEEYLELAESAIGNSILDDEQIKMIINMLSLNQGIIDTIGVSPPKVYRQATGLQHLNDTLQEIYCEEERIRNAVGSVKFISSLAAFGVVLATGGTTAPLLSAMSTLTQSTIFFCEESAINVNLIAAYNFTSVVSHESLVASYLKLLDRLYLVYTGIEEIASEKTQDNIEISNCKVLGVTRLDAPADIFVRIENHGSEPCLYTFFVILTERIANGERGKSRQVIKGNTHVPAHSYISLKADPKATYEVMPNKEYYIDVYGFTEDKKYFIHRYSMSDPFRIDLPLIETSLWVGYIPPTVHLLVETKIKNKEPHPISHISIDIQWKKEWSIEWVPIQFSSESRVEELHPGETWGRRIGQMGIGFSTGVTVMARYYVHGNLVAEDIYSGLFGNLLGFHTFELLCPAHMLVSDEVGRRIGYLNGSLINEIPGGIDFSFDSVEAYSVPPNERYMAEITGNLSGNYEFNHFISNTSEGKSIKILTNISDPHSTDSVLVQGSDMFQFSTSESNKNYSLFLSLFFYNGSKAFSLVNVSIGRFGSHTYSILNWSDLPSQNATMKLVITEAGEGAINSTIFLSNGMNGTVVEHNIKEFKIKYMMNETISLMQKLEMMSIKKNVEEKLNNTLTGVLANLATALYYHTNPDLPDNVSVPPIEDTCDRHLILARFILCDFINQVERYGDQGRISNEDADILIGDANTIIAQITKILEDGGPGPKSVDDSSPPTASLLSIKTFLTNNLFILLIIAFIGILMTAYPYYRDTMIDGDSEMYRKLGELSSKYGSNKTALEHFKKAIWLNPNDAVTWNDMGVVLKNKGKCRSALKCYDKAIKLNPDYERVWYNKGCALSQIGDYYRAFDCFNKAAELSAENLDAVDMRDEVLSRMLENN